MNPLVHWSKGSAVNYRIFLILFFLNDPGVYAERKKAAFIGRSCSMLGENLYGFLGDS